MNQSAKNSAFAKLLEYEKRSRKFAPGGKSGSGPAENGAASVHVMACRLACNIDRITEILPCLQARCPAPRHGSSVSPMCVVNCSS
jgi:hypothetical protein